MGAYVPERGDVVWLSFDPPAGREQSGHRPALVLSPAAYNGRVGLMICCPIISKAKGYPFEVQISDNTAIVGVALADHVKNLAWRARRAKKKGRVSDQVLQQVLGKLQTLLSPLP